MSPLQNNAHFLMCIKFGGVHWHPTHTSMSLSLCMLFHVAGEPPRAVCGGRGKEAVPNPTEHPPGSPPVYCREGSWQQWADCLSCQKTCWCVTYIEYINRYCLTMPHVNCVSFISLQTADWSGFIFHKSPLKYIRIKVLQELGLLQGNHSALQPHHLRWACHWYLALPCPALQWGRRGVLRAAVFVGACWCMDSTPSLCSLCLRCCRTLNNPTSSAAPLPCRGARGSECRGGCTPVGQCCRSGNQFRFLPLIFLFD